MRQAVFSSLGERVVGARFLDLFAGSGAYGLEAVSRGAVAGTFVEHNAKAAACVRQNIVAVCKSLDRPTEGLSVVESDALTLSAERFELPDLVFIDPPYEIIQDVAERLFERVTALLVSVADPVVVFEMPGEIELSPTGWRQVKRLGKGARQPTVAFFRRP